MRANELPAHQPPRTGLVFISYARADDEKPPHDDTAQGWVTFFWDQLRWELTTRGAKQAKLWLDRYQIDPSEAFTQKIEAAVREAAIVVPILSENWAQSKWCCDEIEGFARTRVDAATRIVPIYKSKLDSTRLPEILLGEGAKEGYRFFEVSNRGELNEFYWRGVRDREKYFERLRAVALSVIAKLDMEPLLKVKTQASGHTIFVARCTRELADARQRLVNDLVGSGHSVVPDLDLLPETAAAFEAAIRAALDTAEHAVFLIGETRGITPDGGCEPILDLQLRIVRETVVSRKNLSLVLWTPKWLPGKPEEKRDPFEVVARYGGIGPGEEMFAETVTDLSYWLRDRLNPPQPQKSADVQLILLIASDSVDEDIVFALANLLQGVGPRVLPVVCDASMVPESGSHVMRLIIWQSAQLGAVDSCLDRLPPGSAPICLVFPDEDGLVKRRFFREGIVTHKLSEIPRTAAAARAMLAQLGLLQTGQP